MALYFFAAELGFSPVVSWAEEPVGLISPPDERSVIGSGGGVVAIVQPIQESIPNNTTTARKAVTCKIMRGHQNSRPA